MAEPTEYTVSDVVQAAIDQKPVALSQAFDSIVRDRIAPGIEEIESNVSFGDQEVYDDSFDDEGIADEDI